MSPLYRTLVFAVCWLAYSSTHTVHSAPFGNVFDPGQSSQLPKNVQGFWWYYDIGLEDEGSTAGAATWNQQFRSLNYRLYGDHAWAYKDTNSSYAFPFFGPSGAALFNMALWSNVMGTWVYNEDYTFAQIYASISIFFVPIIVPAFILDMTQTFVSAGLWRRDTSAAFTIIPVPLGNYQWKLAFDAQGNPGPYYNEYVDARGGADVMIPVRVFPPA